MDVIANSIGGSVVPLLGSLMPVIVDAVFRILIAGAALWCYKLKTFCFLDLLIVRWKGCLHARLVDKSHASPSHIL